MRRLTAFLIVLCSPVWASTTEFLNKHWQQPITASAQTTQLQPESCGGCHQQQFADWRKSLHADAMGPGVIGQFKAIGQLKADSHLPNQQNCLDCHAPLQSQKKSLNSALLGKNSSQLHRKGIICAACHVRDEHWYGPGAAAVKSDSATAAVKVESTKGHKSPIANKAFKSAEFCQNCHQFAANGPQLEGKLLQNTYLEWQNSDFSKQGISCQNCHMPDRRHLWQGIHNKAMVLKGLTISASLLPPSDDEVRAKLTVVNSGVGHYFPTYVTPRVILQGFVQDKQGSILEESLLEEEIMRAVSLDLKAEYFDTRLAPGQSVEFDYEASKPANGEILVLRIVVEPDHFYQQFFEEKLAQEGKNALLEQAQKNAQNSGYILFEQRFTSDRF